jgi:hypothetical protein
VLIALAVTAAPRESVDPVVQYPVLIRCKSGENQVYITRCCARRRRGPGSTPALGIAGPGPLCPRQRRPHQSAAARAPSARPRATADAPPPRPPRRRAHCRCGCAAASPTRVPMPTGRVRADRADTPPPPIAAAAAPAIFDTLAADAEGPRRRRRGPRRPGRRSPPAGTRDGAAWLGGGARPSDGVMTKPRRFRRSAALGLRCELHLTYT